jgi:hypothetical protein
VNGLRTLLDSQLAQKIENPAFDITLTEIGDILLKRIFMFDGNVIEIFTDFTSPKTVNNKCIEYLDI